MKTQGKHLIVVLGPTAVGKSALAITLAKTFNCPILSADSRQFYKELSIGTAKPSTKELAEVKHYFINNKSVNDSYSVGDFELECITLLKELYQTHNYVILVGGSGLFINAVCNGLDKLPSVNNEIRKELNKVFNEHGLMPLQKELKEKDPSYYEQVDIHNPQRIIRALEVIRVSGKKYSDLRKRSTVKREFNTIKIGLNIDREALYDRINSRVDEMIRKGLVEEARSVYRYKECNALQTVGYKEMFEHFDGDTTLKQAIELIKKNTRNYAKRQLTWFRKDKDIVWFSPEELKNIVEHIKEAGS